MADTIQLLDKTGLQTIADTMGHIHGKERYSSMTSPFIGVTPPKDWSLGVISLVRTTTGGGAVMTPSCKVYFPSNSSTPLFTLTNADKPVLIIREGDHVEFYGMPGLGSSTWKIYATKEGTTPTKIRFHVNSSGYELMYSFR